MSIRSYAKIVTSINAIRAIGEGLPDVEKRSILKERSDELLILSKEAQKWAFILDSELRQAELQMGELEKKAAGISPITTEDSKDKHTLNFATIYGGGAAGKKSTEGGSEE
jgi:hypothetical protein